MSAPEKLDTRARLLGYSRWAAIGLAILAALTLALSSGVTALRIAAFMAVIAVVLVVVSLTMNGPASAKAHLEEVLLDEIDMLRDDVRADITTAARATHRAIAERVAHLHQNLEIMRRDVDSRALGEGPTARPGVAAAPPLRALPAPAGVVHHTETVHVTTHQTYVDPAETERAERFVQRPPTWRPERSDRDERGDWDREPRPRAGSEQSWSDDRRPYGDRDDHREERRPFADFSERDRDRDRDRDYDAHDDSSRRRSVPSARPAREEPWNEPRGRDYTPPAADPYDDSSEIAAWRNSRPLDRDDDPADDDRWSAMRSGDRWAEVRTDEHGRELRMGERRTAIRADETGTQMRIVDRWSTVRRENPRSDSRSTYDDDRGYDDAPSTGFRGGADNTGETRSERRRREAAEAETSSRRGADESRRGGPETPSWASGERSRLELPSSGPESAAGWIRGREDRDDEERVGRRRSQDISGEVIRPTTRSAEPIGRGGYIPRPEPRVTESRAADSRSTDSRSDSRSSDSRSAAGSRGGADSWNLEPRDARDFRDSRDARDDRWSEPARPTRGGADRSRPEPRGAEPRSAERRGGEPRAIEPRGGEYRGGDAPGADPRGGDRRGAEQPWSAPRRPDRPESRPLGRDAGPAPRDYPPDEDNRWEREPSGGRSAVQRRVEFDPNDDRWR
jgi:hypothetical protein